MGPAVPPLVHDAGHRSPDHLRRRRDLATYLQPSFASLQGHTLFHSWAVDFSALGYPEHELLTRWRMGFAWGALTTITYLVIVMGGTLVVSIYRLGGGDPSQPTADVGELPAGETAKTDTVRQRIKSLFGPGRLAGHPIRPEPGMTAHFR